MNSEETNKKEELTSLLTKLVPPHSKLSRQVTEADLMRVIEDSKILYKLCFTQNGPYPAAYAMAHPQIDNTDPLCFFVTATRKIVINPKITRHSSYLCDSEEGCFTFAHLPPKTVQRFRKIEVDFFTIMTDPNDPEKFSLSGIIHENLKGLESWVYQHEIGHLSGKYIYEF